MDRKKKNYINCLNNFGKFEDVPVDKFIFRPSAYGFVVNDNQIITLTNKSNGKLWFPGGGIEIDEILEDGLKRETLEETGLEVEIKKLVLTRENFFYYKPLDEAYHAFLFFYLCKSTTTKLLPDNLVDDLESIKPRWTEISSIRKEDISDLSDDIYPILREMVEVPDKVH